MALNLQNKYTGRFDPVSADYPQGKFKNRSSPTAQDGSYMERDWLNDWNAFFGALLTGAGMTPNGVVDTATASQMYDALQRVTGGQYGSSLVGSLVHWPHQLMPQDIFTDIGQTYIPYIGQAFNTSLYPKLAMIHPSGVLPADMRGEFPRGFDAGRGVDPSRAIMSAQRSTVVSAGEDNYTSPSVVGSLGAAGSAGGSLISRLFGEPVTAPSGVDYRFLNGGTVGALSVAVMGVRPRNIAWNMIVRAA